MSYTITRTDGSIFAVIPDGTVNSQSSMVLVGKNYAGYGAFLDENFLHLLENGANTTAPLNPQEGQLWWDKTNKLMKVYTGSVGGFKTISSATASSTAPTSNVVGDLWFNTISQQLSAWNGSSFTLIGPASSAQQGTAGALVNTIVDTGNVSHTIIELYSGNVLVGTVSNDPQFSPATPITGFANIRPGIQLATGISAFFQGTATNADLLDNINSWQFLRSDIDDTTIGTLGVLNNGGLRIGATPNQATFSVVTGNGEARIDNVVANANISIRANIAGTPTDTIRVLGANGAVSIPGALLVTGNTSLSNLVLSGNVVGDLTVTGTITANTVNVPTVAAPGSNTQVIFNDGGVSNATSTFTVVKSTGNVTVGNLITSGTLGSVTINNIIKTGANGVGNIGSATNRFGTIHTDFLSGLLTTAAQTNITSVGTLTSLAVTGNVSGGNLSTASVVIGNGPISGVTTISASGNANVGNLGATNVVATNLTGTLQTAAQTNITSVGTLSALTVTGNVSGGNLSVTGNVSGGNLTTGGLISATGNITGGNLSGTNIVGTLTTAAQTNITSVGTLSALTVTGNVSGGNLITAGLVSLSSITKTGSNGVGNIGSSTNSFNIVFARATSAQYADVAERFAADTELEPGTVVELGGSAEITRSLSPLSEDVFGVISTRPAHLMNDGVGSDATHPPVAMTGRVPVKVIGIVRKGDRLVSAGHGRARAATKQEITPFNVIGRSLEDKSSETEGMIEAIVSILK
jgi:hypothetical protein